MRVGIAPHNLEALIVRGLKLAKRTLTAFVLTRSRNALAVCSCAVPASHEGEVPLSARICTAKCSCFVAAQLARVVGNRGFNEIMEATLNPSLKPKPTSDV